MNSQPIPFVPRLSLTTAGATVFRRALPGEALVAGRPLRRCFKLWHHRVRDLVFAGPDLKPRCERTLVVPTGL